MPRILILTHPSDGFEATPYFLREIAEVWREEGMKVTVQPGGAALNPVNADLAILHADLTITPPELLAHARRFPVALNAGVPDISKRVVSRHLVTRGDGYSGPVMIKTDRNYGGLREHLLGRRGRGRLRRCADAALDRLTWRWRAHIPSQDYPILPSSAHVPATVWRNPHLVVERFLPERSGDLYCLRTWMFLGDRETHSVIRAHDPVIKSGSYVRREAGGEPPDDLRRMRRELGFDYGKFDYAMVDGRAVLYDANRTPALGSFPRDQYLPRVRHLAEGIGAFL